MNFNFFNKEFVSSFFLVNLMGGGGGGKRVAPCRYLLSKTNTKKPDRKNKNTDKEKWENIRTHVAACIYLFNQTYSPKPDTTQRNSKECCIWNGSHVHARKLRPQQSAKIKQMQIIFAVKKQANKVTKGLRTFFKCFHEKKKINKFLLIMKGHAVTLQILFLRGISCWWKVEKTFSSLIFWKHGAVNEFYRAIDICFQIRGQSFPSSAVWKSRSCYIRELEHDNTITDNQIID